MNICMISDDYKPAITGVGIHLQCLSEGLVRRGHKVVIITTRRQGELPIEDHQGILVYRLPTQQVLGFNLARARIGTIKKIFQDNKIEIVHQHYFGWLMLISILAARQLKLKMMITQHIKPYQFYCHIRKLCWLPNPWGISERVIAWLMRYACNACDLVLVPSTGMLELVRNYGVNVPVYISFHPVKKPELAIQGYSFYGYEEQR